MSTEPKKRKPFTSTVDKTLQRHFKALSIFTRVPQTLLLDEALEDLIAKYQKERGFTLSEEEEEA